MDFPFTSSLSPPGTLPVSWPGATWCQLWYRCCTGFKGDTGGTRWHVGPQPTRQAVSPKMEVKPRGDSGAEGLGFTRAQYRVLIGFLTQKARATAPVSNEIYWGLSSSMSAPCSIWGLRWGNSGVYAWGKQDVGSFHVTPSPVVSCPHDWPPGPLTWGQQTPKRKEHRMLVGYL